jgi:putative FmdB family regulatory protein
MPYYTYACTACNLLQDYMHGLNESPDYACPTCGQYLHRTVSTGVSHTGTKAKLPPDNMTQHTHTAKCSVKCAWHALD